MELITSLTDYKDVFTQRLSEGFFWGLNDLTSFHSEFRKEMNKNMFVGDSQIGLIAWFQVIQSFQFSLSDFQIWQSGQDQEQSEMNRLIYGRSNFLYELW